MVSLTIHTVDTRVPVKLVHASRGKRTRAEPISAIFEDGRGHMVGNFPALEDELCLSLIQEVEEKKKEEVKIKQVNTKEDEKTTLIERIWDP
jgi:phage terminase large subunit-like protein